MTLEEQRRNGRDCHALAIAELRLDALLQGRAQPVSDAERELVLRAVAPEAMGRIGR